MPSYGQMNKEIPEFYLDRQAAAEVWRTQCAAPCEII